MKQADQNIYKERLLALRARLEGDVTAMADVALRRSEGGEASTMPIHMAELGSDNFEQEFTLSLMQSEEETLAAISEALSRVEAGEYGRCLECNSIIPKTRLNAIPYAAMCVKCAEKVEGN